MKQRQGRTVLLMCAVFCIITSACTEKSRGSDSLGATEEINYEATILEVQEDFGESIAMCRMDNKALLAVTAKNEVVVYIFDPESAGFEKLEAKFEEDGANWIYGLSAAEGGGFYALVGEKPLRHFSYDGTLYKNPKFSGQYSLMRFDSQSKAVESISLELPSGIQLCGLGTDGKSLFTWDKSGVYIFGKSGVLEKNISMDGYSILAVYMAGNRGYVHVKTVDGTAICAIDIQNGTRGEYISQDGGFYGLSNSATEYDRPIINTGAGIFAANVETDERYELFSWVSAGIDGNLVTDVVQLDEDQYLCSRYYGAPVLVAPGNSTPINKKIIRLATASSGGQLPIMVAEFNKMSSEYSVEIEAFSPAEMDALYTQILAGKGPDIINIDGVDTGNGYFEDLLPYIETDPVLSTEEFAGNLKDAICEDGNLYALWDSFQIKTLVGASADLGELAGWTVQELLSYVQSKGAEYQAFPAFLTRRELMGWLSSFAVADFVDWDTGKCSFNSEKFVDMLEMCKTASDDNITSTKAYLLSPEWSQNATRIAQLKKNLGGEICYIGFPSEEGGPSSLYMPGEHLFYMSATSQVKAGAWQFLRTFLIPERQDNLVHFFPILQSSLEKMLSKEVEKGTETFTMEDADKILELVQSTVYVERTDPTLSEIIREEASAYFLDEHSAQETADIIQNRAQIYVSEKT